MTFTADAGYQGPSAPNYTWTVSPPAARILSGEGTRSITVDSSGLGNKRVTAILVVDDGSGDRVGRRVGRTSTMVTARESQGVAPAAAPAPSDPTPPQSGGKVETVDLGDVTGRVCDCGEIPPAESLPEVGFFQKVITKVKGGKKKKK